MSPVPNKSAVPVEAPKKGDFEKSLTRLEEVVKRLESADLSLDEAMRLFEEGVKLSRECQKQLEEAEGRVEILLTPGVFLRLGENGYDTLCHLIYPASRPWRRRPAR